ncbi:MAG: hypothetical protein WDN44_09845 [Sphingomonas sp.]
MEPDRITQIDRELNQVVAEITNTGFRGGVNETAFAELTRLSDERIRLTEPVLSEHF